MESCFLVSNKSTKVRDYLEHRSIMSVEEEHKSLTELNIQRMNIIDVDVMLYIYYNSDDQDLQFRSDLNILRQLLGTVYFNVDRAIFLLIDCDNPMLEDLVHSACKNSTLIGDKLEVIHHSGSLTLNDVSRYVTGSTVGSTTSSSYKSVYIREGDSEETERFNSQISDSILSVLPVLTDSYSMYKKRAEVESLSAGVIVNEPYQRPQSIKSFPKYRQPVGHQWKAFLISGDEFTGFERSVEYIIDYTHRVGLRALVVDLYSTGEPKVDLRGLCNIPLTSITSRQAFEEKAAYIRTRFNQLGFVVENLSNIEGADVYIFLCTADDYPIIQNFLLPLCQKLYSDFVTHFTEEGLKHYLSRGIKSTTLYLSRKVASEQFDISKYKPDFTGTRVAEFQLDYVDSTEFYELAVGNLG